MSTSQATDMGVGLALLFGILAVGGAGVSFVGHGTELAGWGFAGAMTFAALAIAALHRYG